MEGGSRILVIHNPLSRRGRATALETRRFLSRKGVREGVHWIEVESLRPPAPGELPPARAVAVGGDGTVNAAAAWLLHWGPAAAPLGIVPGGTGNNLARGLGIPRSRAEAIELAILGGGERRIDVIRYSALSPDGADAAQPAGAGAPRGGLILQGAAWGFPAEVAARFEALRRGKLFRWAAYPLGGIIYRLLALAGLREKERRERRGASRDNLRLLMSLPGEEISEEALAVFAGNEPTLGGGFIPCPRAVVDDGRMDLCLIRAGSAEPYLKILRRVASGSHIERDSIAVYRQSAGPLEIRFDRQVPFLADGDIWLTASSFRLELLPRALRVVVASPSVV